MTTFTFQPVRSLAAMFLPRDEHRFIIVIGPIGSTKTTSCIFWLLMQAAAQHPSPDGRRRTRFALIRNTLASLKQTVLRDIRSLLGEIVEWRPSENQLLVKAGDIESEWLLMPLETPEDQRRLLSLQLTGVYINELREVDFALAMAAFSRTGRYPSVRHGGVACNRRFLLADSNMGVEGSPMHRFLEVDGPTNERLLYVRQPSALDAAADWLQFLPQGYYADAMVGASPAWIDQHIHANWGLDLAGEPVWAGVFSGALHVADRYLDPLPLRPLLVGIDPGLNPAAVLTQSTPDGQLRVLAELSCANLQYRAFLAQYLIPLLQQPRWWQRDVRCVMDPAGRSGHMMTPDTALGATRELGLACEVARTNELDPRLQAVSRLLTTSTAGGDPQLLIDPRCDQLIRGFAGAYRYVRDSRLELRTKPEKKHPVSDLQDALQYAAMALSMPQIGPVMGVGRSRDTWLKAALPGIGGRQRISI